VCLNVARLEVVDVELDHLGLFFVRHVLQCFRQVVVALLEVGSELAEVEIVGKLLVLLLLLGAGLADGADRDDEVVRAVLENAGVQNIDLFLVANLFNDIEVGLGAIA
jgi:hypothetical protein